MTRSLTSVPLGSFQINELIDELTDFTVSVKFEAACFNNGKTSIVSFIKLLILLSNINILK